MSKESKSNFTDVAKSICEKEGFDFGGGGGKGAFKTVFRIEGTGGITYALKIIRGAIDAERTGREIAALSKCNHQHIAKLHHVGEHEFQGTQYAFTIEEFLSGGTLAERVERQGLLDNMAILRLGATLINAVKYVSSMGLVHRDIKPDNVMFRTDGKTPVLVDFNLVRDLSAPSLTQTWCGRGPGTPYFAAPEQLNNQKRLIDWRSDQFSLGVTLCYVRFGVHPYQYPDEPALSAKTVQRAATRGQRSAVILGEFEKTGFTCLEKMTRSWPVERFRKPAELEEAWKCQGVE